VIGLGNSTLDDVLDSVVTATGRTIVPDPESEKGFFYRSDHFEFAKEGVPALYADGGVNFVGKPSGWGLEKRNEYTANDYHKPSDELSGLVAGFTARVATLALGTALEVANGATRPRWSPSAPVRFRGQ